LGQAQACVEEKVWLYSLADVEPFIVRPEASRVGVEMRQAAADMQHRLIDAGAE
jgi:hypothetical protein